jgi:methylated-DNA-[protein]-cysteine S-methyltransferase
MTLFSSIKSPCEQITLCSDGLAITGLYMTEHKRAPQVEGWERQDDHPLLVEAERQLQSYFAGELRTFDLPLSPAGTAFQQRVWEALLDIPFGSVISYGELARRLGDPKASRAVGLANGRNPISIIIPCHRVIGVSGDLTGYGGGIDRKRTLLALESTYAVQGNLFTQ